MPYEPADPLPYEPVDTSWPVVRSLSEPTDVARRGSPGAVTSVGGLLIAFAVGSAILVALTVAFIVLYWFVTGDPG